MIIILSLFRERIGLNLKLKLAMSFCNLSPKPFHCKWDFVEQVLKNTKVFSALAVPQLSPDLSISIFLEIAPIFLLFLKKK